MSDPDAAAQATQSLVRLMLDREQGGWAPDTEQRMGEPRIVLAIDELDDLLTFQEIQRALTWLARRGRRAGIHLLACAQRPSDELLADFPVQLAALLDDDLAATGAERLCGPGRFVAMRLFYWFSKARCQIHILVPTNSLQTQHLQTRLPEREAKPLDLWAAITILTIGTKN